MNQKENYQSKIEYLLTNGWKRYSKEEFKKFEDTWAQIALIGDELYFKPGTKKQIEAQKRLMGE